MCFKVILVVLVTRFDRYQPFYGYYQLSHSHTYGPGVPVLPASMSGDHYHRILMLSTVFANRNIVQTLQQQNMTEIGFRK